MKVACFSTKSFDRQFFEVANANYHHKLTFFDVQLNANTAVFAADFPAVCMFVNDIADAATLDVLASRGTRLLALRSAGFNTVDLQRAADLGIKVVRVPAYSPYSVAEFAVGLVLMLNRKLYKAYNRVRDDNFSLEGLLDLIFMALPLGSLARARLA